MSQTPRHRAFSPAIRLALLTFVTAGLLAVPSQMLADFSWVLAMPVLLGIIVVGILFDMLGMAVAVAVADEAPFHAMASNRIRGARQAIRIVKNASVVSSFASDFVGDVMGTLAGALAVAIGLGFGTRIRSESLIESIVVATVAALAVGGKAYGKSIAMLRSRDIVLKAGVVLYWIEDLLRREILPERPVRRKGK